MNIFFKLFLIGITILVILSFLAFFHLMLFMRKKINRRELNYWFIILLGVPVIGVLLYIGFIFRKYRLKSHDTV